jgi:glycosyltransferase involved in cell wall biosynthesis
VIPEVSVIIPYYRGERWLPRCLAGVLAQQGATLEVVVADDGSETSPPAVLSDVPDERIRLVRLPHRGKGATVNAGAAAARGEYLCVLDQDDEMLPGRLAAQVGALRQRPELDGAYSDYERRTDDGRRIDVFRARAATLSEMLRALATGRGLFSLQTLLLRRRVFDDLAGFCPDERLTGLDDAEFFVRLLLAGYRLQHVPGVFGRWTSHAANYSRGERFQEARLAWLERLAVLAEANPALTPELPHFRSHTHVMRGLFFLETGNPDRAAREFRQAARARPWSANTYYLLAKSLWRAVQAAAGGKRR